MAQKMRYVLCDQEPVVPIDQRYPKARPIVTKHVTPRPVLGNLVRKTGDAYRCTRCASTTHLPA